MAKKDKKNSLKLENEPFEVIAINSTFKLQRIAWELNKILSIDFEFSQKVEIFIGFEQIFDVPCCKFIDEVTSIEYFLFHSSQLPITLSKDLKFADFILYYKGVDLKQISVQILKKIQMNSAFTFVFIPNNKHFNMLFIEDEAPEKFEPPKKLIKTKIDVKTIIQ